MKQFKFIAVCVGTCPECHEFLYRWVHKAGQLAPVFIWL